MYILTNEWAGVQSFVAIVVAYLNPIRLANPHKETISTATMTQSHCDEIITDFNRNIHILDASHAACIHPLHIYSY
jgi:hypothetical protein